jgi:hydrogenase/urease accessory protein HupE
MTARRKALTALWLRVLGVVIFSLVLLSGARAHESRPAYLQINETAPYRYEVLWRTPLLSGMRLPVVLNFSDGVSNVTEPAQRELPDSLIERRLIEAKGGLAGQRIEFVGLQATITDVLVRVQTHEGGTSTTLVHPSRPWIDIARSQGPLAVAGAYLMHGIEHILFGFDHLMFVFALILIVGSRRMLLLSITAFTVAHSITLTLATLGVVHVPGPPVEATIALSILLLACEIARSRRGQTGLTARWPWVVAFSFGLIYGLGFASGLIDIGLPPGDVEVGQLGFIVAVIGVAESAKRVGLAGLVERRAVPVATYAIVIMAAYWFIERVSGF